MNDSNNDDVMGHLITEYIMKLLQLALNRIDDLAYDIAKSPCR